MKLEITKEWFEKRAVAEGDHEIGAGRRKTMTINLTEEEIAELERLVNPAPDRWRCFHCDEVFYDKHSAKLHFGMDQCSDPVCKIKMGAEGSLVTALRRAEAELADAWAAIHNESTEAAKAYYAQQSRHGEQLRAAEELGYERGLTDGIEHAARFVVKRRDDYVSEHGSYDPSTGITEFPGYGDEYVYELDQIAEMIRALKGDRA